MKATCYAFKPKINSTREGKHEAIAAMEIVRENIQKEEIESSLEFRNL